MFFFFCPTRLLSLSLLKKILRSNRQILRVCRTLTSLITANFFMFLFGIEPPPAKNSSYSQ